MTNYFYELKPTKEGREMKVSLSSLPPEAWTQISGAGESALDVWRKVPFMRRAVDVVAWGITQIPFHFTRAGNPVTSSSDYVDPTKGLLPNPRRNFSLIASSLLLYGQAYQHIEKDAMLGKIPNGLKWLKPSSVAPVIDKDAGLIGFTRTVGSQDIPLTVDEVLHFWPFDPDVEVGPPLSSQADAALRAAGAASSVDEFIKAFFDRGAIKATVFTASNVLPADQERMKTWLERMFSGVAGAFRPKVFNADKITPVIIGEGIESLENQALSGRLREDIATALGIPQSILFSNASNFAVSTQDFKNLITLTIAPMADVIADTYNTQLLNKYKLSLQFDPESMDIFQEEEQDRSGALVNVLDAVTKAPPKVVTTVMQMLGMELPGELDWGAFEKILSESQPGNIDTAQNEGVQPAMVQQDGQQSPQNLASLDGLNGAQIRAALDILDGLRVGNISTVTAIELLIALGLSPERARAIVDNTPTRLTPSTPEPDPTQKSALHTELEKWERKAMKAMKADDRARMLDFESDVIPVSIRRVVLNGLENAGTIEEIKELFENLTRSPEPGELVAQFRQALEMMST